MTMQWVGILGLRSIGWRHARVLSSLIPDLGCPPTYLATKGAVHSWTKYLACYFAKDKIRVNSVTPHGVYNNHKEVFVRNVSHLSPLGRMSEKEEVAPTILSLLSDKSSYITRTNMKIDGGWTAR
jgi:NAD(P)-dependent dehydrogenase (short-subunit alcohol dehydrogenase family)